MNGYDFDGVVTAGMKPGPDDVIITGRTIDEAAITLAYLRSKGIWCPVFFNSCGFKLKSDHESGSHKAQLIQLLGIKAFFEDSEPQAEIIAEFARGVEVRIWSAKDERVRKVIKK